MADRTPLKIKNNRITQFETSDSLGLVFGGTGTDLSLTGGVGQFLRQSSAGAAITVSAIGHADLGASGGTGSKYLRDDMTWQTVSSGVTDHGALTGLSDDDHTQYALLAGRSGGQILIGGTASGDDLTLQSTSHATRGTIFFGSGGVNVYDDVNSRWGFGVAAPARTLEVRSTSAQIRVGYDASNYAEFAVGSAGGTTFSSTASNISTTRHFTSVNTAIPQMTLTNNAGVGRLDVWHDTSAGTYYQNFTSTGHYFGRGTGGGSSTFSGGVRLDYLSGASGEFPVGGFISPGKTGHDLTITPISAGTAGRIVVGAYFNGLGWLSALEWGHVASGYGNLKLMKSGGVVGIGMGATTPARALEVRSTNAQQRWSYDASNYAEITVSSAGAVTLTATGASDGFCIGDSGDNIGFYGVTTVARPSAYTQTYSTADRTLGAYTADDESVAYTGAADGEAQLADLNALRTAYENLRAFVEDIAQMLNSVTDDLQAVGLLQ